MRGRVVALARALAASRRARLVYCDAGGTETEREIDPLALSWRRGAWLLAARCHRRRAFRLFRVDRILRVRRLAASVVADTEPAGFDARFFSSLGYLEPGFEAQTLATVWLGPPLSPLAMALFPTALLERCAGGAVLCHLRVTAIGELASLVASLRRDARLIQPIDASAPVDSSGPR
jgi:predicted DNA-binding transcriptional regulator YafY